MGYLIYLEGVMRLEGKYSPQEDRDFFSSRSLFKTRLSSSTTSIKKSPSLNLIFLSGILTTSQILKTSGYSEKRAGNSMKKKNPRHAGDQHGNEKDKKDTDQKRV